MIDNWKNAPSTVFEQQYSYNLQELDSYPQHWQFAVDNIREVVSGSKEQVYLLDIGCGCGAFSKVCEKEFRQNVIYCGIDYSPEAIKVAKQYKTEDIFPFIQFYCKDYKALTQEDINKFSIVYASSLHNVLPNGDECLEFLLSLKPKQCIFTKLLVTDKPSFYETYTAYNEVKTYKFFHNYNNLQNMFKKYGYGWMHDETKINYRLWAV